MSKLLVDDKSEWALFAAFGWMVGTLLSFCFMAVAIRELSDRLEPFQIQFLRSIIGLSIMLSVVAIGSKDRLASRQWGLTNLRNFIHVAGQLLWTWGIELLPLAMVFALEFTSPIWATILAIVILGERMTSGRAIAVAAGFIGILIIVRPGLGIFDPNILVVLTAAIFFGCINVITKQLTRTDTPRCIVLWMCAMQSAILLAPALWVWNPLLAQDLPWIVVVGIGGLSAHYCMSRAFQLADAVTVLPMEYLRLPMIGFVAAAFYGEPLDPFIYLGSLMILGGIYVNLRNERRRNQG